MASCRNNLAEFYRNIGRYEQAEQLYLQVWRVPWWYHMVDVYDRYPLASRRLLF